MTKSVFQRILVIANPMTRVGTDRAIEAIRRYMPADANLIVRYTQIDQLARDLVADVIDDVDLVIAVGGDGIVSQAAAAIAERPIPLGIIPAGSTNMIAKVGGIPKTPDKAAQLIFGEHFVDCIDVGVAGDFRLVHAGGAGIDARVFAETSGRLKRKLGWVAYVPTFARNISASSSSLQIVVDDEHLVTTSRFVFICNSAALVFANLKLLPHAGRHDGAFDVLIFTADNPISIAATFADFLARGLHRSPRVIYRRATKLKLLAEPEMPVEFDGDVIGVTPVEIVVKPGALQLIVRPRTQNKV